MTSISTTQAAAMMICSLFVYMVLEMTLGPCIDMLVYIFGTEIPLTPLGQRWMSEILPFGSWTHHLIKFLMAVTVVWFFVFIIRRIRYQSQPDEYDFYKQ